MRLHFPFWNFQKIVDLNLFHEDEGARPKFEDIQLFVRFKIVNKSVVEEKGPGQKRSGKEVTVDWEEQTLEGPFKDVKTFACDVAEAATNSLSSVFFNNREIFKFFFENGRRMVVLKLQERILNNIWLEEFR